MNNTITEMKTTLEGINSRLTEAEERISELEDRMVVITATQQNKAGPHCTLSVLPSITGADFWNLQALKSTIPPSTGS